MRGKVSKRPDFHMLINEKEHIYIEIEPPFYKPFEGSKPSSRLKAALKQIAEWKEILTQQAIGKENFRYVIILGRLDDMNEEEKENLQSFNKTQRDLTIITWDWILENINKIKHEIINKPP